MDMDQAFEDKYGSSLLRLSQSKTERTHHLAMSRKRKQQSALDAETKEQISMKRKEARYRQSSSERYVSTHLIIYTLHDVMDV